MFEKIKKFYEQELWTISMVQSAVTKGIITQAQCEQIIAG